MIADDCYRTVIETRANLLAASPGRSSAYKRAPEAIFPSPGLRGAFSWTTRKDIANALAP